jgi:DNA-binding MarR family transcriptional regulator
MVREQAEIDDATSRRVQEMVVLVRLVSHVLNRAMERAGVGEVSSNRSVQVLMQLKHGGPQRPRELQGRTGLTSGGLTKLIDRLVALGLVERHDRGGTGDGRAVLVRLTRAGHAAVRKINDTFADAHDGCRPMGKDLMRLAEACGARPADGAEMGDLLTTMVVAGRAMLAALGDDDERHDRDDYLLLVTLSHIDLTDEARPGSMTELLSRSSGGVSKLLDRFEAQGYLQRSYGGVDADRRAVVLRLTPAGRQWLRGQTTRLVPYAQAFWDAGHVLADGVSRPA